MASEYVEVIVNNKNEMRFIDHGGYESRAESSATFFSEAFSRIKDQVILKPGHFFINIGDISSKIENKLTFGYTTGKDIIACPNFVFDKYVECGIANYQDTVDRILESGSHEYTIDKMFWAGNLDTQPLRRELLKIGMANTEKMEIVPMQWHKIKNKGSMHQYNFYMSLQDQTKYKYLIDCGALGYSCRVKLLLHSNRPLFLVDRQENKTEFFHKDLKPFIHYIPVKSDLSDLVTKLEWAEDHYSEATNIARNARSFAIENLSKKAALSYLADKLLKHLNKY